MPSGNRISTTDANGNSTLSEYDELNRVEVVTDALGATTTYYYDEVGNQIGKTDAEGNYTSYVYDGVNRLLSVTDALGGPEFETLGMMGSNLEILDPKAVARASQLAGEYGLDTLTMGGLAGYLFECVERGLIQPSQLEGRELAFGDPESLFWLIETVGEGRGELGQVLAAQVVGQ